MRKTNNAEILLLKKDIAFLREQIYELKTNHLVHLQVGIDKLQDKMEDFKVKVYTKLDTLKTVDDQSDYQRKLGARIIEIIILGVVTATLVLIGIKSL